MRRSEAEYRELARRAGEALLKLPGVHSVGIGGRERAGTPTGEVVIKVMVERKLPRSELQAGALVPDEFEGIPTDVVECPAMEEDVAPVPGRAPAANDTDRWVKGDRERRRPLIGGSLLQAESIAEAGTLGFLMRVTGDPKRIMGVTNKHVLYGDAGAVVLGRKVGQPDPEDSCTACCRNKIGTCIAAHYDSDVDAALIRLDEDLEWVAEIYEIGFITGPYNLTVADATPLTYQIRKRGRTTLLTGGTLQAINVSGSTIGRSFSNGILVKPNPNPAVTGPITFRDHGDSGAAYVNDRGQIVGIHFMGGSGPHEGWGVGFPIAALIGKFQSADAIALEVATATALGQTQTVPRAATGTTPADVVLPVAARRLQADLDRTSQGRELITVWLRHSSELNRLVNTERRVAAMWRHVNGPEVFRQVITAADNPIRPLPREIAGRPADVAMVEFLREVERYASPELQRDLARQRPLLASLPGRSYDEIVRDLH